MNHKPQTCLPDVLLPPVTVNNPVLIPSHSHIAVLYIPKWHNQIYQPTRMRLCALRPQCENDTTYLADAFLHSQAGVLLSIVRVV